MQERLSVGNVKLLHAGGGLPHVHYFPTKEDEQQNLVKDGNDPAKKSYMRSVVCSKTSLLVLVLLLVALTSYLVLPFRGQEGDDDTEEISVTERLLINHGDSIKYQSIAHNFKLKEKNAATANPTEEELSESVTNVVNEKQGDDDSINDSTSQDHYRVPTEDEAEEVASEIHSDIHRLAALMNDAVLIEWTNSSEKDEIDLMMQPATDTMETTMAFLVFLIQSIKEAQGSITTQKDEFIPGQVFFPDLGEVNHPKETYEPTYPSYNDDYDNDYDDDYKQDNFDSRFLEMAEVTLAFFRFSFR